ncbi:MAG: chemotaxis response regulator protein-glutamate methylesterase [Arenimonas sp.]
MRIGIANDSPIAIEALRRSLGFKAGLQIAWTATNGADAVAACGKDTPDLVLMDLLMPGMDGVEATRQIMAHSPCAILVVTASIGAQSWRVFEAMGHGALDAVDTPALGLGEDRDAAAMLLRKINTISRLIGDKTPRLPAGVDAHAHAPGSPLVVIGASSGGPAALAELLGGLPADLAAPVLIVQHIDKQFAAGMADWLKQYSPWPVRVALEAERPEPGVVLLAGTADHLVFKSAERVGYTAEPVAHVHRPSVDVFFDSCQRHWRGDIYAALLTGMGRDGALAMKRLRDKGHYTVAQDAASSAVYGMPKAAAELGAAVEVLPLDAIASRLARLVAGETWRGKR